ncbi:MAG: glycosyltransferase 87 family protein [Litorimonas sp.]
MSEAWTPGTTTADHPVSALIMGLTLASLSWLALIFSLPRGTLGRVLFVAALLAGLTVRLSFFGSNPVYEDDWQRYLWDGAVVAKGLNPYSHSPQVIADAGLFDAVTPDLQPYVDLDSVSGGITARINNPDLSTIYPPVAQAAFGLAHALAPFQLDGLRTVFLLSDLLTLGLLILALTRFGVDPSASLLFWLNPVAIFAVFNGAHMDGLLLPPLVAALLLARRRPWLGGAALAVAAAVKIWPLLLAPLLFRHLRRRPAQLASTALVVTGFTTMLLAPMVLPLSSEAGLVAYSSGWTNSSFLFPWLRAGLDVLAGDADRLTRILVAVGLAALSLWLGLASRDEPERVPAQALGLVAALIWLSPTGYSWYLVWLLAFLPFAPRAWAGALFAGAAAYYVRFWLGEMDRYDLYTLALVPLWYGVPLLLLAAAFYRTRSHGTHPTNS